MDVALNARQTALAGFSHHLEVNLTKAHNITVARNSRSMAGSDAEQSQPVSERARQFLTRVLGRELRVGLERTNAALAKSSSGNARTTSFSSPPSQPSGGPRRSEQRVGCPPAGDALSLPRSVARYSAMPHPEAAGDAYNRVHRWPGSAPGRAPSIRRSPISPTSRTFQATIAPLPVPGSLAGPTTPTRAVSSVTAGCARGGLGWVAIPPPAYGRRCCPWS